MALVAHVDDSGSEPSGGHFVLSGYVHNAESWAQFSDEWSATLDFERPIEYLKASEVWDWKKGEFKDFTKEERRAKVEALVEVIEKYNPLGLSVSMNWEEFQECLKFVPLQEPARNPYFFLFYSIIGLMLKVGHENPILDRVDFIFDNQNGIGRLVWEWWPIFRENASSEIKVLLDAQPLFKDEKKLVPLQAADLFAWYSRREVMGSLDDPWHMDIWERLRKTAYGATVGYKELWHIAEDLGVIDDSKLTGSSDGGAI